MNSVGLVHESSGLRPPLNFLLSETLRVACLPKRLRFSDLQLVGNSNPPLIDSDS
jgi:hypothetical protein